MIEIQRIDAAHAKDLQLPNEPFDLFGRLIVTYVNQEWSCAEERFPEVMQMCFPDEHYDYAAMTQNSIFLGAYEGDTCVGLAVLQQAMFRYLYLYDLKVNRAYRKAGVGRKLLEAARDVAQTNGYRGIYTIGQDNNLGACRFYLKTGFQIGGLDTRVYGGTSQEGKSDILFYLDI